jgi:NTE family protein
VEISREIAIEQAAAPVVGAPDRPQVPPREGVALCLSGGGYRAMLFHVGALRRLNELGRLRGLDCVSAVSGGSITAGLLGLRWQQLDFVNDVAINLDELVLEPLFKLAGKTIDVPAFLRGVGTASPGTGVGASLRRKLYGDASLQALPDPGKDAPLFVFNATSLQSGVLRRFSKLWAWDYKVGRIDNPQIQLAAAVAASASFPPFLSPSVLRFPPGAHTPGSGDGLEMPPFTTRVSLTDGGVYDNLGLETAWDDHTRIMISDAGGELKAKRRPWAMWALQILRLWAVTDNQVRSLRKRQAISAYAAGIREGPYWGIRTDIRNYELPDALEAPCEKTLRLAKIWTGLHWIRKSRRHQLMNWGYAVCDAALRKHVVPGAPAPADFPYPGKVG